MSIDHALYDAVTFDCFGTLVDWDTGIANFLAPWAVSSGFQGRISDLMAHFAKRQYEHQCIRPFRNYRVVIRDAMAQAIQDLGGNISEVDLDRFSKNVGEWPAFPDTVDGLRQLKAAGLHLGVLSNVDNASFDSAHRRLGGLLDTVVTAEMAQAYKPDLRMFEALFDALSAKGIRRKRVLHVAQSRFHDVAPGNQLGLDVIWIDRRHGRPGKGVTVPADANPKMRFTSLEEFCAVFTKGAG